MKEYSRYFAPAVHVTIWLLVLLVPALVFSNVKLNTGLPDHYFFYSNLYHIGLFYLNAYYLYPRLFNRRHWPLYIIVIVGVIALSFRLKLILIHALDPDFTMNEINVRILFFPTVVFLLISFLFRLVLNRIRLDKMEREKRAERLASELKFLRSQVSPHFLFNVLTNMVSLARKKSNDLESMLIKLSDLLRYMLYETGGGSFPLGKEFAYLENYIELQQLRFGDNIKLELTAEVDNPNCLIEPMLLIPFVENAYKHGTGVVQKPYIKIYISLKSGNFTFTVTNKFSRDEQSKDKSSGIGLANVRNRLNLLYKNNHRLIIEEKESEYVVTLNLFLKC